MGESIVEYRNQISVEPSGDLIDSVMEFVKVFLRYSCCPDKCIWKMLSAVDELFGNIVLYANCSEPITITCWKDRDKKQIAVQLADSGVPFNPLTAAEPVMASKASLRKTGGLGIHISKNLTDEMRYEYRNGKNMLTVFINTE